MKRWIRTLTVIGVALGTSGQASAQEIQRIAAVVNDEVISVFDLAQRIRMVLLASNAQATAEEQRRIAPQVLRLLIDEQLRVQEAERQNVRLTSSEMSQAIEQIERNNNVPPGQFGAFVAQSGLAESAVRRQVEAQLTWEKFLARRVRSTIEIGDEEIDAVLNRIDESRGQEEYRLAEILLPIDDPAQAQEVRSLATNLFDRLREGATFSSVARQFSQSATAANGGEIGWIRRGQLGAELDAALDQLRPGEMTTPIVGPDGIRILMLIDLRTGVGGDPDQVEIALRQILLPLEEDAAVKLEDASATLAQVDGCPAFAAAAAELGLPQPPDPTRIKIGDLNERLRNLAQHLPVGQISDPLETAAGTQLLMICDRDESTGLPDREEIREMLARERVDMLSRRYIRDLRRAAIVDIRI